MCSLVTRNMISTQRQGGWSDSFRSTIHDIQLTLHPGMKIFRNWSKRWIKRLMPKGNRLWPHRVTSLIYPYSRYLWISDNTIMSQQKGVFRVNCIDCLDRTNVVQVCRCVYCLGWCLNDLQSAFARFVLNKQLGAVALLNPQGEVRTGTDLVFNDGEY